MARTGTGGNEKSLIDADKLAVVLLVTLIDKKVIDIKEAKTLFKICLPEDWEEKTKDTIADTLIKEVKKRK